MARTISKATKQSILYFTQVMRMLKNEIYKITDNADAEISCVRFNNDIKYVREKKGRVIVSSYLCYSLCMYIYRFLYRIWLKVLSYSITLASLSIWDWLRGSPTLHQLEVIISGYWEIEWCINSILISGQYGQIE